MGGIFQDACISKGARKFTPQPVAAVDEPSDTDSYIQLRWYQEQGLACRCSESENESFPLIAYG